MSFLNDLTECVAPPSTVGPSSDWEAAERALGFELPDDYKDLVDLYGPGAFDGFLWLLTPAASPVPLEIVNSQRRILAALRVVVAGGEALPAEVTDVEQLVAWAVTDNGDTCYWIREGGADSWRVAVNASRADDWFVFGGSATEFLYRVLSRSVAVAIFPADFPSAAPFFAASAA